MRSKKPSEEIEIKLRVSSAEALCRRLKQLRARVIIARTYESNTLFDTASEDLTLRGQLIRIRSQQPCPDGKAIQPGQNKSAVLTFKGPSRSKQNSRITSTTARQRSRFKIRNEIEVGIGDEKQMKEILHALGYRSIFRYEKFRITYGLPKIQSLKVEFDETPIGLFLELEGSVTEIDRAATLLGYTRSDYMTQTYGDLYIAHCRERGRKPTNMLFVPTRKMT